MDEFDLNELKAEYIPEDAAVGGAPSDEGAVENGGKPFETEGGKTPSPVILSEARSAESKDPTPYADGCENEGDPPSPSPPRNDGATAIDATGTPSPKKRRVPLFWKIYAIAVAVVIMLICGLLGFFRAYLREYEETRPINAAREAVSALASGENRPEFIPSEASEFDRAASVAAAFAEAGGTAEAEIVEKVGVSTEDVPVFSVREDGREVCRVRLREGEKRRFFRTWQVDGVFFTGDNAVDITLTADTRLLLNGVQVGEGYVTSRDEPLRGYEDFTDVTPKCVRYQIEGLFYEPVITLENDYCEPRAEFRNGEWTVAYPGSESSRAEAVQLAYSAAQAYVTYASSLGSPLAPLDRWLIPGSTLRARVLSFNRRYFTRHDSAEFKNMTDLDFSVYGADEFSVKLAFDYVMRTGGKEQTDKTVITLYMLRIDGSWKLSDVAVE